MESEPVRIGATKSRFDGKTAWCLLLYYLDSMFGASGYYTQIDGGEMVESITLSLCQVYKEHN